MGNALSMVSWVMVTANRVKGRAVVIVSVDATHLLMASKDSDVVGMKAVPQTPQGPQGLTCVFYEQSAKYNSSAADTLSCITTYQEFNMGDGKWVKMVENGQQRVTIEMCHIPNA